MPRLSYTVSKGTIYAVLLTLFVSFCSNLLTLWILQGSKLTPLAVQIKDDSVLFLPANVRYASLTVEESDRYDPHNEHDWSSLFPKGHGFVRLPSIDPEDPSGHAFFAISMYHQLHCLNSFRRLTVSAASGNVSQHHLDHAVHCLSYLRQLLLCHADVALEPARPADTVNGGQTQAVYGEGTTHVCRDWAQVRAWAEDNYDEWRKDDVYEVSEGGMLVNVNAAAGTSPHRHAHATDSNSTKPQHSHDHHHHGQVNN
ncbi:hypothetical protein E1B28_005077 [Marasmius oreades]|uniref:Uncharacterized protein n=1 Tax=Marasmius oreades TaxID=181124 RepID=A0A9P7V013_9AGAR|nr:uncharacterized protein E1B28_005077 [Marasmius oreades]KAG7097756.1 hypothetical protein E1B28_005077 [Marasmius oreades]